MRKKHWYKLKSIFRANFDFGYSVLKNNSDKGKFPKVKMVKFQYEKGRNLNPCFATPKVTRANKH